MDKAFVPLRSLVVANIRMSLKNNTDLLRFCIVHTKLNPPTKAQMREIMRWYPSPEAFDAFLQEQITTTEGGQQ